MVVGRQLLELIRPAPRPEHACETSTRRQASATKILSLFDMQTIMHLDVQSV